jgi:GT2 family glycosyltransferase
MIWGMQIVAVVVLYKTNLERSSTMISIGRELSLLPDLLSDIRVLVWDNGPVPLSPSGLPVGFEYQHSPTNAGVSGAYNGALRRADHLGAPWLLLLDQDSSLPVRYLESMLAYSRSLSSQSKIGTVVPFVESNGINVSPRQTGWTLRSQQIPETQSGIFPREGFAINSGTLVRVSALREIGGYSNVFWLDLSDQYVFHQLHEAGFYMYVAANLKIQHSIANSNYDTDMSEDRYRGFLAAENVFSLRFHSRFSNGAHNLVLLLRAVRQFKRFSNKGFAKLTLLSLTQRLLLSRSRALEIWMKDLSIRDLPAIAGPEIE